MNFLTYISLFILAFILAIPDLSAGDPVPGLDLSLHGIPGGKTFKTKTNNKGEFSFKNLPDGNYVLTISYKGQSAIVGKKSNEKLVVSSKRRNGVVISGGRDKSSGMPTGKRQHKPITITKQLDKASPKLASALAASYNSSLSNKSENRTSDPNTTGTNKRTKYSNITLKRGMLKAGNSSSSNDAKLAADKVTPILTIKVDGDIISGSLKMKHQSASNSIRNMK